LLFAIPQPQQLRFERRVSAVCDAITIQVTAGPTVPHLQLRGFPEQQAARLELHADARGVDRDGNEYRVAHGELADARHELRVGRRERQERVRVTVDAAAVVDL